MTFSEVSMATVNIHIAGFHKAVNLGNARGPRPAIKTHVKSVRPGQRLLVGLALLRLLIAMTAKAPFNLESLRACRSLAVLFLLGPS